MRKTTAVLALSVAAGAMWSIQTAPEASAVQSAARVYASKCSGCHAPDGTGSLAGAPNFTSAEWQASRSDAQLAGSIKNGRGKLMPAWGEELSDAQISALVRHVRGFKK
jgi:cbb3-type cytochrome c oxidase subunit III